LIVLVIFGASRLPQLGKGIGQGLKNFKEAVKPEPEPPARDKTPPPPA
jgi:sec-independent protein translocase protein TatA